MREQQFGDHVQRTTHVIATCTATKAAPLTVRWNGHDAASWVKELEEAPARHRVRDLYAGPAWSASKRLFATARGEAHVASAGLGLTSTEQTAPSYDATFTDGADSSITSDKDRPRVDVLRDWWSELCLHRGQSLTDLAAQPDASLVVVASGSYLDAMHDDLHTAAEAAGDRLVVIGVDARQRCKGLESRAPTFDARVLRKSKLAAEIPPTLDEKRLPGGTATLGTVVAIDLLKRTDGVVSPTAMMQAAEELMAGLPETAPHRREQLSDDQVIDWIDQHYRPDTAGRNSATGLLRLLRDHDKACEQSRFRGLFQRATEEDNESAGVGR